MSGRAMQAISVARAYRSEIGIGVGVLVNGRCRAIRIRVVAQIANRANQAGPHEGLAPTATCLGAFGHNNFVLQTLLWTHRWMRCHMADSTNR